MQIYIVKQNDSVDSIARQERVPVESIIYVNQLTYPYPLAVGQALLLERDSGSGRQKRYIYSNGYAYPFINPDVLEQTLPYLSELSIFSYGFTTDGMLIPPELADEWMIEMALLFGVAPILTLTPFGPDGKFNNYLISVLVNDLSVRATLIDQLIEMMEMKGFSGVDVDFEYILREDRDAFTDFVAELTRTLNPLGYQVSVALAPKTSTGQQGLLYEGKDYGGLGAAANHVLLMTYEWGYTYGPPMAVAPINLVRQVVEYAVTQIPVNKINLGIPNYGYDWPLPFERNVTAARTIGNIEAVQIAAANGAIIQFDAIAMSPYFYYMQDNIEHVVWFEDVRSMQAKFDLINEFDLRGAGYWQIMKLFRANWLLLAEEFWIRK